MRATDFVGVGLLRESRPCGRVDPGVRQGSREVRRRAVPAGQKKLAATVHDALQYVIDQATVLADRIDARQAYSFTYSDQFTRRSPPSTTTPRRRG